uniref:Uncharacterized protein n=1 Tax=Mycena chlorophos TaxID=658473 RepID=A0ABQ0LJQ1_MYCCL|nr:predicted protein [Mycena chlorophos]
MVIWRFLPCGDRHFRNDSTTSNLRKHVMLTSLRDVVRMQYELVWVIAAQRHGDLDLPHAQYAGAAVPSTGYLWPFSSTEHPPHYANTDDVFAQDGMPSPRPALFAIRVVSRIRAPSRSTWPRRL